MTRWRRRRKREYFLNLFFFARKINVFNKVLTIILLVCGKSVHTSLPVKVDTNFKLSALIYFFFHKKMLNKNKQKKKHYLDRSIFTSCPECLSRWFSFRKFIVYGHRKEFINMHFCLNLYKNRSISGRRVECWKMFVHFFCLTLNSSILNSFEYV